VLDCCIGTRIGTSAAFNTFPNVFCGGFPVDKFKDLNWARGYAFARAFTFIIVNGDGDITFFEFFLHSKITSFVVHSVTTAIILDFLFSFLLLVKKYQGSFIKKHSMRDQKTNHPLILFFMHEVIH
jgi:hypothetical protein